jgi:hypothetical protein
MRIKSKHVAFIVLMGIAGFLYAQPSVLEVALTKGYPRVINLCMYHSLEPALKVNALLAGKSRYVLEGHTQDKMPLQLITNKKQACALLTEAEAKHIPCHGEKGLLQGKRYCD